MENLLIEPWQLAGIFGLVAFLYSSVGLAGGSSYIALLTIFGVTYSMVPTISLSMNILVSSLGAWNFIRGKHARAKLIFPFLATSIPFSWIGGSVHLPAHIFQVLLFIFLAIVALRIYCFSQVKALRTFSRQTQLLLSLVIGASLGFIGGALGLGGGIYLIPLIVLFGLGEQKEAAASGVIFIWVNSLVGLMARLGSHPIPPLPDLLPLLLCVAIGGYAGSFLGANKLTARTMQRLLGLIILVAMGFLLRKFLYVH